MKKTDESKTKLKRSSDLTKSEKDRWKKNLDRAERKILTPRFEVSREKGLTQIPSGSLDADFLNLTEAMSSSSEDFTSLFIRLLHGLGSNSAETLNASLGFLSGIQPKDEMETMLACQMFATNLMSMRYAGRALYHDNPEAIDANVSRFNRLSKRFIEQMEALNKHRGKGQQKVTVEHVNVHSGGQAIVGNVEKGEG